MPLTRAVLPAALAAVALAPAAARAITFTVSDPTHSCTVTAVTPDITTYGLPQFTLHGNAAMDARCAVVDPASRCTWTATSGTTIDRGNVTRSTVAPPTAVVMCP